jgi:hypothetical protein
MHVVVEHDVVVKFDVVVAGLSAVLVDDVCDRAVGGYGGCCGLS